MGLRIAGINWNNCSNSKEKQDVLGDRRHPDRGDADNLRPGVYLVG
jgi:hypothetical protein